MRLLLSSSNWEDNLEIKREFLKMVGNRPSRTNIFLVNIAKRNDKDWRYVMSHIKALEKIGINKKNIKVFNFGRMVNSSDLNNVDIIYVCGGNTFQYLFEMRVTGLDKEIIKSVKARGAGYFGVSAGAILAGPKINIAGIGKAVPGDKNEVGLENFEGLGLTDVIIYPHYSEEDEEEIIKFERRNSCKVVRLRDGQALVVRERGVKVIIG